MSDDKAQLFSGAIISAPDLIDLEIDTDIIPSTNGTILATFKYGDDIELVGTMFVHSHSGRRCYLGCTNGFIGAGIGNESFSVIQGSTPLILGEYYRGAVTWDSTTVKLFLDGIKEYENPQDGAVSDDIFTLFGSESDNDFRQIGPLGNIQIFDRALTEAEILEDYENCYKGLTIKNPIAWYPCIEGSGTYLYDWSGNGHHCNMVFWPDDDSYWLSGLSVPLVIQTALIEWARGTNNLLYSNTFSEEGWHHSGITLTTDGTLRLDGREAILLSEDGNTSTHYIRQYFNFINPGKRFFKVRIKQALRDKIPFYLKNGDEELFDGSFTFSTEILDIESDNQFSTSWVKLNDGWYEIFIKCESILPIVEDGERFLFGDGYSNPGINGPAVYIDGIYCSNELGASILTWDTPAINAIMPINPAETSYKSFKAYEELNWNGGNYADAGNEEDVNPSTALILEIICNMDKLFEELTLNLLGKLDSFEVTQKFSDLNKLQWKIFSISGEDYTLENSIFDNLQHHYVLVYDSRNSLIQLFIDGNLIIEETLSFTDPLLNSSTSNFQIGTFGGYERNAFSSISLISLYTDDIAQTLIDQDMNIIALQMFNDAQEVFPLTNILTESDIALWDTSTVEIYNNYTFVKLVSINPMQYSIHPKDTQYIPVYAGSTYTYRFWAQLDEFDIATYAVYDVTNSIFIVPETDYSNLLNHETMTMVNIEFTIPTGCMEIWVSPFHGSNGPADLLIKRYQTMFKQ